MIPAGVPQPVMYEDYYSDGPGSTESMADLYFPDPGPFSEECARESDEIRAWAKRADETPQGPRFVVYCCPVGAQHQNHCPEHGNFLKESYADTLTHLGLPPTLDYMFHPNPFVDEGG